MRNRDRLLTLIAALAQASCGGSNDTRPALAGDVTVLKYRNHPDIRVHAGFSEEDLDRMAELYRSKDYGGAQALVSLGRAALLSPGTRCRVIDPGLTCYEVRILEGRHEGKYCFVMPNGVAPIEIASPRANPDH